MASIFFCFSSLWLLSELAGISEEDDGSAIELPQTSLCLFTIFTILPFCGQRQVREQKAKPYTKFCNLMFSFGAGLSFVNIPISILYIVLVTCCSGLGIDTYKHLQPVTILLLTTANAINIFASTATLLGCFCMSGVVIGWNRQTLTNDSIHSLSLWVHDNILFP